MTSRERRQTSRKTLEKQTYINIGPNNVGMVLNVSAGGLCFHSVDPVKRNATIGFGLSGQQQRIEAEGVVMWTDEAQRAGLRFTSLSQPARDKIRDWLSHGTTTAWPVTPAAQGIAAASPVAEVPKHFVLGPKRRLRLQFSGFSRGLATGLLISAFVGGAFLFHGYRHQFGEWLIRTGERFAAKAQVQSAANPTPPQPVLSASHSAATYAAADPPRLESLTPPKVTTPTQKADPAPKATPGARFLTPVLQTEKIQSPPEPLQPSAGSAMSEPAKLERAQQVVAAVPAPPGDPGPKPDVTPAATKAGLESSTSSSPVPSMPAPSNLVAAKLDTPAKPDSVSQAVVRTEESRPTNVPSTSEVFFEVGKFKNPLSAHTEADKVARLGFPASAVQKGFLWTNSYHILVGPYSDEEQAKTTHDTLISNGFKPRTFERGSRSLILVSGVSTDGGPAPEGEYVVSWESYVGNASVKFLHNNSVVTTANARWVKRDAKYPRDTYVYRKNPDGSRTLLEIHFEGMRKALVFGRPS